MLQEPLFTKWQNCFGDENSVTSVSHLHREIHDGSAYKVNFTSSATTSGDIKYLQINGASGYKGHLKEFSAHVSDGFLDIKFIQCSSDSTHTTGSAAVTPYNKNRVSSNTANLGFFSDPADVSSTGSSNVVIDRFQIGGTGGSAVFPTPSQALNQEDEWIIGNSTYILEISCATTSATFYLNGSLIFYEEASTSVV